MVLAFSVASIDDRPCLWHCLRLWLALHHTTHASMHVLVLRLDWVAITWNGRACMHAAEDALGTLQHLHRIATRCSTSFCSAECTGSASSRCSCVTASRVQCRIMFPATTTKLQLLLLNEMLRNGASCMPRNTFLRKFLGDSHRANAPGHLNSCA
jgi:hypothetical protein